jgi:hypothetical protein
VAAPPEAGITQLPLRPSSPCRCPKPSVQVAPASSSAQAVVPGAAVGRQARAPEGPVRHTPGFVPPSLRSGRLHASPEAIPEHASTTAAGGELARPQKRVPFARPVLQVPSKVCPAGPVTVHAPPEAFPLQAFTRKLGGPGGVGTQARPAPSSVLRQLPGSDQPPSRLPESAHASPPAFPEHASSMPSEGAQRRGPMAARLAPASRGVPVLVAGPVAVAVRVHRAATAHHAYQRQAYQPERACEQRLHTVASDETREWKRAAPGETPWRNEC